LIRTPLAQWKGFQCWPLTVKLFIEKSCGGRFYGTGIEIWAGFGPVWQLLRPGLCFHGQKINFKNIADGENKSGIE